MRVLADTVVSSEALGVKTDVQVVYLNVGVHLGEHRLPVAAGLRPGKRFDEPTNYLHVLLRNTASPALRMADFMDRV
jgi:hypothetical protein